MNQPLEYVTDLSLFITDTSVMPTPVGCYWQSLLLIPHKSALWDAFMVDKTW